MDKRSRELTARVVKLGVTALTGGWKSAAGGSVSQFVDAWAGSGSPATERLRTEIGHWAHREGFGEATVDFGFEVVEGVFTEHGASMARVIELGRDPVRIADEVTHAATARLDKQGPEAKRVAEQIAVVFYRHLVTDPDMADMLDHATNQQTLELLMGEKAARLADEREARYRLRENLVRYLTVLVDDITVDPWPRVHGEPVLSVTDLERTLTVTTGPDGGDPARAADEVADSSRHLVVLGGAGTGKTWLARRIARRAAEAALESLRAGANVEDLEVPLLVTCEQFRTAEGTPRQAAVGTAIDSRSDLGAGVADPLKKHLLDRDDGVLLVLDSLDEATTGRRDVDHALIGSWRTVITTRPDAWHNQWDSPPSAHRPDGQSTAPERLVTTATLQALSYPEDVRTFVYAWHHSTPSAATPGAAEHLMDQLGANQAAREMSTVPLFLTFLCLVAPDGDLPTTRSALMDQVVNRLLEASWRRADPDPDHALGLLLDTVRGWAWHAARNDPVNGLSDWPDSFVPDSIPASLTSGQLARLDAIAPRTATATPGTLHQTPRRFVHRALHEHLVAQTVAGLPADEAFDHLLSHWWYDQTWAQIIPAALAQHPDRDSLLGRLWTATAPRDLVQVRDALNRQTTAAFLSVCVESHPEDWNQASKAWLDDLRARVAPCAPKLITRSQHWHTSNTRAVEALTAFLPIAAERTGEVARALVELDPSRATRTRAVDALIADLPIAGDRTREVARAVVQLDPSEVTRTRVIGALSAVLPAAERWTGEVARALVELDPGEASRAGAVDALIAFLPIADWQTEGVARALVELDPGEVTRARAVDVLATVLPTAWQAEEVVRALATLATSEVARARAVDALTAFLPTAWGRAGEVARALVALDPGEVSRARAVEALAAFLPIAEGRAGEVARALVELDPGEVTRARAVDALTACLPTSGQWTHLVACALVELDPSEVSRARAVDALTACLPIAEGRVVEVARALVELDPSEVSRARAVDALAAFLPIAGGRTERVARALVELDPGEVTRARTGDALTACLPTSGQWTHLVACALVELDPSEVSRARAVDALMAYMPTAGWEVWLVAETVRSMCSPVEWLRIIREGR